MAVEMYSIQRVVLDSGVKIPAKVASGSLGTETKIETYLFHVR